MKKFNKKQFTMVEMMMIVGILCILISISWVAGTTIIRKSALAQTRAEVKMLHEACVLYKDKYGSYPLTTTGEHTFNFVHKLSNVEFDATNYQSKITTVASKRRPMYIDFRASNFNLDNDTFDGISTTEASITTTASDPYDQPYEFIYTAATGTVAEIFYIKSDGLTSSDDDDVRSDELGDAE